MLTKVKVKDIRPNPFQARKGMDHESVEALAEEIKSVGLWAGALRARKRDGRIELCFGHRRLEAVKKLGWQDVEVDLVDLTDEEMATQSLIENLQREGLNDVEKAEGIVRLVETLKSARGYDDAKAIHQTSGKLGLSPSWTKELMRIATFDDVAKDAIRKKKIAGRTALEAHRIGGSKMIEVAARKSLPVHTLTAIGQRIGEIKDDQVREKIKKAVLAGEVTTPDEIQKRARMMEGKKKKNAPPDLVIVIARWTGFINDWTKNLDEALPYREYIDTVPPIAEKFRKSVRGLIERLEKFL
jgi:ParB/RepB/Spo0J family partition protein